MKQRIVRSAVVLCLLVFLCVSIPISGEGMQKAGNQIEQESQEQIQQSIPIPSIRSILAKESGAIKLRWEKVDGALSYEVYRRGMQEEDFSKIADTKKHTYTDATGQPLTTYIYKVRAVTEFGVGNFSGEWEKACRKMPERTAYVGDSVMSGFEVYGFLNAEKDRSFAQVSRRTAMVKDEDLPSVIDYNPDRVFLMMGINDCIGNKPDEELSSVMIDYGEILDRLHDANPAMEMIVCGISPTRSDDVNPDTVQRFNNLLQKIVGERPYVYYYDTGKLLRGEDGRLLPEYGSSDGIHWNQNAYDLVFSDLQKFVRVW